MNGRQFVKNLIAEYGMLEGYRMAERYLETKISNNDTEEIKFRDEMRKVMHEVDQI